MLDWNRVLRHVKRRLALPSGFIEKTDEEIKEIIIDDTIPDFSTYYPDKEYAPVICTSNAYKHPTKPWHYIIKDDENLDIIGIANVYFPQENDLFSGHPPLGPMSFEGMGWWSLSTFKSRFMLPYSNWNYSFKFIAPNYIKILQEIQPPNFVVEYERVHPHDLRKIPTSLSRLFLDLALADVQLVIGGIRSLYGDGRTTTPYGEIPLNGSELLQQAKDERDRIIAIFQDDTKPGIVVDIG